MTGTSVTIKGIAHGRTIELERDSGVPDGQAVSVVLRPMLPRGDGLRKAFGSWRHDGEGLESFVREMYENRQDDRPEPGR